MSDDVKRVEELSAELHSLYQAEAKRHGCRTQERRIELLAKQRDELKQQLEQAQRNLEDEAVDSAMMMKQLRERAEHAEAELNETWTDEHGTVWTRPTALAYAQVCKARDARQVAQEAAEARVRELEAKQHG